MVYVGSSRDTATTGTLHGPITNFGVERCDSQNDTYRLLDGSTCTEEPSGETGFHTDPGANGFCGQVCDGGGGDGGAVIVQVYDAVADPPAPAAVALNVWLPTPRLVIWRGLAHDVEEAASSEQLTDVAFCVVHANAAAVSAVDWGGVDVRLIVGAVDGAVDTMIVHGTVTV
jgi:hypothetical protein